METSTNSPAEQFDDFWEASTFSTFNIQEFSEAQEEFNATEHDDSILLYPQQPHILPRRKTLLSRITSKRKSVRSFGTDPLTAKEMSTIFSSFACIDGLEHRTYPSAGARYSLEIFCIANNTEDFPQEILYYNPDIHALSTISKAPSWNEIQKNVNVETQGTPQCLLLFVVFPHRLTDKYAERGGRFTLIETGAALQQLSLNIAESKHLKGVAAGGLIDEYWLDLLNLNKNEAKIALGFLCGK